MTRQTALTGPEWGEAYDLIRDECGLRAKQRDLFDASPLYYKAMAFALSALQADGRADFADAAAARREVRATLLDILSEV